jgi:hypothetical protein
VDDPKGLKSTDTPVSRREIEGRYTVGTGLKLAGHFGPTRQLIGKSQMHVKCCLIRVTVNCIYHIIVPGVKHVYVLPVNLN